MEAGILNWGADITLEDNVYEAGLGWLVDPEKRADYIGKDALRRIREEGVRRRLVGIEIAGDRLPFNATKWPVRAGADAVGQVTSAVWSPRLGKNIGYAMVPSAYSTVGTSLHIDVPDVGERAATVVPKPFVDPGKDIPKA